MFLLPERGAALEVIHQKVGGLEGLAPVASGGGDEDDGLARFDLAGAVQDQHIVQRKPGFGFIHHAADLGLGEAGVGFQFKDVRLALARAGDAGERDDGAGLCATA